MITKTLHDNMPFPSAVPTTMDEMSDYIDTLAAWMAEALGLVVREDLTVEAPSYAPYSYVKFLAESANADPYLAIYNPNTTASSRYSVIGVMVTKKSGNDFMPITILTNVGGSVSCPQKQAGGFSFFLNDFGNTYRYGLIVADFNDGRKIAIFEVTQISNGNRTSQYNESMIYLGNIRIHNTLEKTCVILSSGFNSAWIGRYEQNACVSSVLTSSGPIRKASYSVPAIYFNNLQGKEFMTKWPICIGEDAYLENIYQYSDSANLLYSGTIIEIDNKRYICAQTISSYDACFIIPEEVN